MNEELAALLATHEKKLDAIYSSVERARKYMLAMLVISLVVTILPLIGIAVAVPMMLQTLGTAYGGI